MELTENMINNSFPAEKRERCRLSDQARKLPLTSAKPDEIIDADFLHHFPKINKPF